MIQLTEQPIDTNTVLQSVQSPMAGAVVLFLGTVREETAGRKTASLDYESYPAMAFKTLETLEHHARSRWTLTGCTIVHRLGHLAVGELSVAIAVSSAHREAAFAAAEWLLGQIKSVVPIWKKENWADGSSQWIHPGIEPPGGQGSEGAS